MNCLSDSIQVVTQTAVTTQHTASHHKSTYNNATGNILGKYSLL